MKTSKLAIIGSGPAGYTAALYAARANLEPILYEGFLSGPPGGQLMSTTDIENFPGFPKGIAGSDLMGLLREGAERFGTRFLTEDVLRVDLGVYPYQLFGQEEQTAAHALIIATGARALRLDIPGTRDGEFWQKGVSACAICDGAMPIFRNQPLFVIGGGDSAIEEALFLTKYASRVFIVHRRDALRASKIMQERVLAHPKVEILWNSIVLRVEGDTRVRTILLQNVKTGEEQSHPAAGLFFAVGHSPNSAFLEGQLELLPHGYIAVEAGSTRTSKPMVFAAGDVQDFTYRQAISAAGSGCMAALDAERALSAAGL